MMSSFIEIVNISIKFLFVIKSIQCFENINNKHRKVFIFYMMYILGYYIIGEYDVRNYVIRNVYYVFLIWWFYQKFYKSEERKYRGLSLICLYSNLYELINVISAVVSTIIVCFIQPSKVPWIYFGSLFLIFKCITAVQVYSQQVKERENRKEISIKGYTMVLIYLLVICVKIPFLYTDMNNLREFKLVIIFSICATVIFFIISKIEKRNVEQEKARIQENNKILSTKLHKSREILPAMVQVLSNVTKSNGIEMEQQEAHKLLQEVNDLYGQQLKENSKEDLQLKSFCSTGLTILDQQLSFYQREAIEKDINFDIYVQAPINELLKKDDIDQLRLQRALGDLVRNAFRVMEREDKKCQTKGHILLIIGCKYEDILEIGVVDNGAPFPLYVIETFGKRGVTTGGMGNGLADLVEFAKEIKASICLDEFEGRANSFTKKISIVFDKREKNYFNSVRSGLITGPFWSTT